MSPLLVLMVEKGSSERGEGAKITPNKPDPELFRFSSAGSLSRSPAYAQLGDRYRVRRKRHSSCLGFQVMAHSYAPVRAHTRALPCVPTALAPHVFLPALVPISAAPRQACGPASTGAQPDVARGVGSSFRSPRRPTVARAGSSTASEAPSAATQEPTLVLFEVKSRPLAEAVARATLGLPSYHTALPLALRLHLSAA